MPRVNNENVDQPAECIVRQNKVMAVLNIFLLSKIKLVSVAVQTKKVS